jgi:sugar-specific transcriptional regulator TrmB
MNIEKSLESLGLTQLEALAYAWLVANPSSTGYRVARGIGKPTANVYRALESLGRKGAVLQDRAATPSFRALAPDDLLAQLEREFMQRKRTAAEQLASLQPDEADERIYALNSPEQVMTRARVMVASARRLVLVDAMTSLAAALESEIAEARTRRVRVLVRSRIAALAHDDTIEVAPSGRVFSPLYVSFPTPAKFCSPVLTTARDARARPTGRAAAFSRVRCTTRWRRSCVARASRP